MKRLRSLVWFVLSMLVITTMHGKTKDLNRMADSFISKDFTGTILLAEKGKIKYLQYAGPANRREDITNSAKTRFHIYSITKTFTATLILQLYEQGRINLDSTIAAYYPEYTGEAAHKVTIRNLLTYSSGRDLQEMRNFLEVYSNDLWPPDTFINRYCSGKLVVQPGTQFNYNNGDFIILGRIIEHVYQKPYETVLQEKILTPLHMANSGYIHHQDIIKNMAEGYAYCDTCTQKFYTPTNAYIDNLFSAGAMYSTAEDLLLFDQAIFNHTILKKATVDLMLTPYANLEETALGFWVYPKKIGNVNTMFVERQGSGYGFHSNWVHLLDQDITLILLENNESIDLNQMRFKLLESYLKTDKR